MAAEGTLQRYIPLFHLREAKPWREAKVQGCVDETARARVSRYTQGATANQVCCQAEARGVVSSQPGADFCTPSCFGLKCDSNPRRKVRIGGLPKRPASRERLIRRRIHKNGGASRNRGRADLPSEPID